MVVESNTIDSYWNLTEQNIYIFASGYSTTMVQSTEKKFNGHSTHVGKKIFSFLATALCMRQEKNSIGIQKNKMNIWLQY